jgi:hypothetical protein
MTEDQNLFSVDLRKEAPEPRPSFLRAALASSGSGIAAATDRASHVRVMQSRQFGKSLTVLEVARGVETAQLQAEVEEAYPAFVDALEDQLAAMAKENAGTPNLDAALRYTRLEALRAAVVEIRKMGEANHA